MIKLTFTKSNLLIFRNFISEMDKGLFSKLESNRKLTMEVLQLKVDKNELSLIIDKLDILLIKNHHQPGIKKITFRITPSQSFLIVKYKGLILPVKLNSAETVIFSDYSSIIHKQITDLAI